MGFRSDWEAATAAANNPDDQYHDAGVAYTNAVNDYIASTDRGQYDLSNKTTPQKPQSYGYYKATNKLADYALERGQNNGGQNYGSGNSSTASNDSSGGGKVYGSPRYGGTNENPDVTGKEWNQPGTGFGTGNFLGMALEDINSGQDQTTGTAPVYGTPGYRGVPKGGVTQGTEWNQPGTGFGTGNFAGGYAELIDLMRNGNTLEEAQAIINNRNELETIQNDEQGQATQPQTANAQSRLNSDSIRAFKDYQVAGGPNYNATRPRQNSREDVYNSQFQEDLANLRRQFPNYSYSALADMVLAGEEMKNGQSSYYKWLASNL